MPKKPVSARRRARKKSVKGPIRPLPGKAPTEEGAAVATSVVKPAHRTMMAARREQAVLDLSYIPGDLKRIGIMFGIVLVLLVVLGLVLRSVLA